MKLGSKDAKSIDDLGKNRPKPGTYLVVVKHVDDTFDKNPDKLLVEFEAISGTVPGQAGKTHTEYFSTEDKHLVRITRLCMACGLLQPGEERDVDLKALKGKPVVICLEEREYEKDGQKKHALQISYHGIWNIDHAEVKDVPKDREALAIIGAKASSSAGGQQSAPPANGQQSLPGTQTAPASGGGKWSGI